MPASRLRLPAAARVFNLKADVLGSDQRLRRLRVSSVDQRRLLKPVRQTLNDLLGPTPFTLEPWGKPATFHYLYKVMPRRGAPLLVRVHRFDPRGKHFQIESWIDAHRKSWRIPGPEVLKYGRLAGASALAYLVTTFSPGRPLNELKVLGERRAYWRKTGRLLAQVHRIRVSGYGPLQVNTSGATARGAVRSWAAYLRTRLEVHVRLCQTIGSISTEEATRIRQLFKTIPRVRSARLLHGDLNDQNLLVRESRLCALLDWEDALAGDPVFDLALWGTFHERGEIDTLLKGYRTFERLPRDFEHRYWLYFLRIALSKTVHRFRFGYRDRPQGPPASQRIQWALAHLPTA